MLYLPFFYMFFRSFCAGHGKVQRNWVVELGIIPQGRGRLSIEKSSVLMKQWNVRVYKKEKTAECNTQEIKQHNQKLWWTSVMPLTFKERLDTL